MAGKNGNDTLDISALENWLWDAACSIRGAVDAPKFKDYILPLIFIKRMSDVFDDEIDRLALDFGDRETALEMADADRKLIRFWVPEASRWQGIRPLTVKIGEKLPDAVRALAKENPDLSGVIDIVDFNATISGERAIGETKLSSLVETVSKHQNIPQNSIATAERLSRHELREDDILFARRGVIGRHGLVGKKEAGWICGTGCFLVRLNYKNINNKFLSFHIATPPVVEWLNANAAGAIMPNLNSQVIAGIPVYYPPVPDQEQIVSLLTGLDNKIDAAEAKNDILQDFFKTMLHELMTGSIRTTGIN